MLIKKPSDIPYSEVTPKSLYMNRRKFLAAAAAAGAGLAGAALWEMSQPATPVLAATKYDNLVKSAFDTTEKITPMNDVTHYNNFYEFGTDKSDPAKNAQNFKTSPWKVAVEGEVKKKRVFQVEEIIKLAPPEERIYRHRCVEGWSIVVPWIGFPLSVLIKQFELTPKAKYVAFETLYDPKQMPGQHGSLFGGAGLDWPYVEGLRIDEAMHPLAILCFGMYGESLPNQDGAPIRMVIPWKYGFKSIKSIVKIKFVEKEPPTTWNEQAPNEYGFYSNVNPDVDHPRWSQATERRLGEFLKRKTLMFNGYADQVASLYNGMDLRKNY